MKRKLLVIQILYYLFIPLALLGCLACFSLLLRPISSLGAIIAATYALLYIALPILTVFLIRLSLLRWYVDPFAAAQIPLFLYLLMVIDEAKDLGSLMAGFTKINSSLLAQNGEGWIFLMGLFLFGLLASFSVSRKEGQSISYKLLSRIGFFR